MLPVCLGDVFFASWNKVGWNENRIRLSASSGVFSTCCGSWFWSGTRTCLVRPLRYFCGRSICSFLSSAFCSCSDRLLSNMSVVRCAVVESFPTGCASKPTLGSSFSWAFRWRLRADFCVNRFSQRLHSYGLSPFWISWWVLRLSKREKVLPQVSQRYSLRGFLAAGSPTPDWIAYNWWICPSLSAKLN